MAPMAVIMPPDIPLLVLLLELDEVSLEPFEEFM